jgi:serine phosphatase RsbU (regulator of sigma subunit)
MSPRQRLLLVVSVTFVVLVSAASFTVSRMVQWHAQGWIGASYSPVFPGQKMKKLPKTTYGTQPGEVLMTFSRSPADGKLLAQDTVIAINGIPIEDVQRLRALDASLDRDSRVVYRVRRNGRELDVPLHFATPFRTPYIVVKLVVAFLVAGAFVLVALLVFARRPDDRRATVFFAFSLVSAVAVLGSAGAIYDNAAGRGIVMTFGVGTYISVVLFLFTLAYAPLVLHLSLIFPRERPILHKWPQLLRWIYAGALLATLIALSLGVLFVMMLREASIDAPYWFGYTVGRLGWSFTVVSLILALLIIFLGRREGVLRAFANRPFLGVFAIFGVYLGMMGVVGDLGLNKVAALATVAGVLMPLALLATYPIFAVVSLVRSYRSAGVEERKQVQWPLWGLLIAVGTKIVCLTVAMSAATLMSVLRYSMIEYRSLFNAADVLPTLATLLIPVSFAAAILKYRLMNIDIIIRKTVSYAILSALIVILYLILVGGLGSFAVYAFGLENQTTMIIGATLVVALLFVPLRNKLQTLVDRNLFRHRYDYPEALRALGVEARTAADASLFLTGAAEKLQQALQNRAVVIFAERQEELVVTAKVGVSDTVLGRLRIPRGVLDVFDGPFDPRREDVGELATAAFSRIEASLAVPTGARGLLTLSPKLSRGEFEPEDIDFVRAAAAEIAIAIERIRMQAEEEDYAQARAIQETLLPREMPTVRGLEVSGIWQPARTMGGDYFDVLRLGEQELAVCIGDVAGKGMPAALLMSGLQAAVRASASDSPRDLCERVRRVVVSSLSGGRFVTFFYATLDTATMRLRWCNAGHNAPILARSDGTVVRLEGGGPAFNRLFRASGYEQHELPLLPGDRLVMFTDGLSEATDAATGEMIGEARIEEMVVAQRNKTAAELQQAVVSAVAALASGELEDDLTLVVAAVEA